MSDPIDSQREQARLWALQSFRVLDTPPQTEFDDLVRLARGICGTSIALVSLVDRERLWFKARLGVDDVEQIPRSVDAFCCHAISEPRTFMEVEDARQDERFAGNALVNGELGIRFYAAMPLTTQEGEAIGTFCVLDREPRSLDDTQRQAIVALARVAMELLHARRRELVLQRSLFERDYHSKVRHTKARTPGGGIAVIGVDNFRGIQNCFADAAGTRALDIVQEVIDRNLKDDTVAIRYGSSDFLVILSGYRFAAAAAVLEQIRADVAALALPFPLTVSVGAAIGDLPTDSIAHMYECADQALARARAAGGNRVLADERAAAA